MPIRIFALLGLFVLSNVAAAPLEVRLVEGPAWCVRDGARSPLQPGQGLNASDRVVTGKDARVLLALSEGSTVKLGAEAELDLTTLVEPAEPAGLFKGFPDVVRGAFHFTTTVVGRRRDIEARIGTATIGIRGTDVWGKHEAARDFVVLLEGHIEIARNGQTVAMTDANSLYMAPTGSAALPLAAVNPDDLARWAQETEPQSGAGQRSAGGSYRLMFRLEHEQAVAQSLLERLAEAGYGAELTAVTAGAHPTWRVSLGGYENEAEAQAAAKALAGLLGDARPWLSHAP